MVANFKGFQLEGVEELKKKFQDLRGAEMRKVYRLAVREAAKPVLSTAKQIAPIGETGKLVGSLKIRAGKRSQKKISVVVRPGTRKELGIPSDAKGYYPAHIELGFKRGKKRITVFPANRYLRDAMELERADAIRIISNRIEAGIRKVAT